jgi:hypothetical protein
MFGQRDIFGAGETPLSDSRFDRFSYNLVRAVTNTAQAHIGATRPKPKFATNDADWTLSRRAMKNEQAVRAIFHDQQYYKLSAQAFIDAAVSSLGGIKVFFRDGKVRLERVYPGEILVDHRETYHQHAKHSVYQIKMITRDRLKEMFSGQEHEINKAQTGEKGLFGWLGHGVGYEDDRVLVIEAYRPADDEGKNGKHTIAIRDHVLFSEEWKRECAPFAWYRWETRQAGFFGMGIVEELRPAQRTLNRFDQRINHMMQFSQSKLVYSGAAKINEEHLNNDSSTALRIGSMNERPIIWAPNVVPPEWWQERERIKEDAFRQIGVNRMQMSGEKPPGIQAAVALRELNDQGSRRFRIKVQEFEQLAIDTARLCVQELNDASERGDLKPITVRSKKRNLTLIEDVDWKKVALEEGSYEMQVQSASSLPDSTPGRIQTVQDWYSAGFINQQEAKQLLEFPDLEAFQSLDLAPYHVQLDNLETIIEDGEYVFPEPTDDLELALKLATLSYNKYRLRKAPADRLELLLQYLSDVEHWQKVAREGEAGPQQIAAGVAPAITGLQEQLPGGISPQGAAGLLEAGAAAGGGGPPLLPGA